MTTNHTFAEPAPVIDIKYVQVRHDAVALTWRMNEETKWTDFVIHYKPSQSTIPAITQKVQEPSVILESLIPGQFYDVEVRAQSDDQLSDPKSIPVASSSKFQKFFFLFIKVKM